MSAVKFFTGSGLGFTTNFNKWKKTNFMVLEDGSMYVPGLSITNTKIKLLENGDLELRLFTFSTGFSESADEESFVFSFNLILNSDGELLRTETKLL